MFKKLSQPLDYAEALLAQFSDLSRLADGAELVGKFIQGVARLSGCELVQLYLLDVTRTRLEMNTESLDGQLQFRDPQNLPSDYHAEQLLQFSLCQNRVVCLDALSDSVHETGFLPPRATPWQSLLCVPLGNPQDGVGGLLLCASNQHLDLQGIAESLRHLGTFALGQMHLLQRLRGPVDESVRDTTSLPSAISYGLIGKSMAMRKTCSLLSKVLNSPYTVLLRGETGTGKEVVARVLHDYGPRRSRAFIVQN